MLVNYKDIYISKDVEREIWRVRLEGLFLITLVAHRLNVIVDET